MTDLVVQARGLTKVYGAFEALKGVNLDIPVGRIVGVIGSNGAGKTTMLNAILGLSSFEGELSVLGMDPDKDRAKLMEEICFISDVATLPRWMTACQLVKFVEEIHPKFDREECMALLSRTSVPLHKKVSKLSKGMIVQLHLAIVMSIDAKLLVLDEPTLGLDILFRKDFYKTLLEEYFDENRTIIITTHQVEEVEHILTDVIFIKDGQVVLAEDMDSLTEAFTEILVSPGQEDEVLARGPIATGSSFGKTTAVFRDVPANELATYGDVRRLGLADIFFVTMRGESA